MKTVSLQSHILCPECTNAMFINVARGMVEITHPTNIVKDNKNYTLNCSRIATRIHRKDNGIYSIKEQEGGIAVVQIPTRPCPECKGLLYWTTLPDKIRLRFDHGWSVGGLKVTKKAQEEKDLRCYHSAVLPIATFTIFI